MPSKAGQKKRATKTQRDLRDQLRKTADQMWSNYDLNWWWEFDPLLFAPPRARPHLEDARRSFLLATRELLDSWIEWTSTSTSSGRSAGQKATGRNPSRRVPVRK